MEGEKCLVGGLFPSITPLVNRARGLVSRLTPPRSLARPPPLPEHSNGTVAPLIGAGELWGGCGGESQLDCDSTRLTVGLSS